MKVTGKFKNEGNRKMIYKTAVEELKKTTIQLMMIMLE